MRDYVKELLNGWTEYGEQAAYTLAGQLIRDLRDDVALLKRQESAIQALGAVLREHPAVDSSADPADSEPGLDVVEPSERSRMIINAAVKCFYQRERSPLTATRTNHVSTQEVLDYLRGQGLDLGVQQPLAVIGTVLANADGFDKIARNTFEFNPEEDDSADPDAYPF